MNQKKTEAHKSGRDAQGKWLPGNRGGPGRRPIEIEHTYLKTMRSVVTQENWKKITLSAIRKAEEGDRSARDFLAAYLLGNPDKIAPTLVDVAVTEITRDDPVVNAVADTMADREINPYMEQLKETARKQYNLTNLFGDKIDENP